MALFSNSFLYFLSRLCRYNLGYLRQHPKSKKHPRRGRNCRWFSRKRGRNRKKTFGRGSTVIDLERQFDTGMFTSALNVYERSSRLRDAGMFSFDTDSSTIVCDNSANFSICNDKRMFVGDLKQVTKHKVATIGGKGHAPSGLGTVKWRWVDDNGKSHEYLIHDVLYFPQSPINILSVTSFPRQLKEDKGTGMDTKMEYSRVYWDFGKHERIIKHQPSNLPQLSINEGFSLSNVYLALVAKVINPKVHTQHSCCLTNLNLEDDGSSGTLDEKSTCSSQGYCKTTCNSTGLDSLNIKTELFEVGETLFYSKDGYSTLVKITAINLDKDNMLRFSVIAANGNEHITTREHLRSPDNPDIGWIPSTVPEYQSAAKELSEEDIESIT